MIILSQQIGNPYLSSFTLGLFYGLTFCTSACLPYVTSYIAGIGAGFRKGLTVASTYNLGRIIAYALLGLLTGLFRVFVSDRFFLAYQKYASIAFGAVIILIGVEILMRKKSCPRTCSQAEHGLFGKQGKLVKGFDIRALSMGFTRGLILCPPLAALLLYSVTLSASTDSVILATLFGLGTALSPLLILGGVTGWLLNKAPLFSGWISKIGAGILVLLGFSMLLNTLIIWW
ncbi:MAG: sulfite exporter TauE/SafE family protein [Thermoproteota archaeon]